MSFYRFLSSLVVMWRLKTRIYLKWDILLILGLVMNNYCAIAIGIWLMGYICGYILELYLWLDTTCWDKYNEYIQPSNLRGCSKYWSWVQWLIMCLRVCMDWGDMISHVRMCMMSLCIYLTAFEWFLPRSRTNVYLSRGECNDPTNHFEF